MSNTKDRCEKESGVIAKECGVIAKEWSGVEKRGVDCEGRGTGRKEMGAGVYIEGVEWEEITRHLCGGGSLGRGGAR